MKKLILLIVFAFSLAYPVYSQDQSDLDQRAEDLMRDIHERMRSIEQSLARASLEPEDLMNVLEQLHRIQQDGSMEELPLSMMEFLYQNSEWVHDLAQQNNLELTEDQIKELLENDNTGGELLERFPNLFDEMMQNEEQLLNALDEYQRAENDLERLFGETEREMERTEGDIQRLLEMAEAMQQQMNQTPSQREQLQQEREEQLQNEPQGQERGEEQDGEGVNEDSARGDEAENDPNAWDIPGLPQRDTENYRDASRGDRPRGYEAESDAYFRMLARAARLYRESQESQENDE